MWDNLLIGTIGSVIGVVAAVGLALAATREARNQQRAHADLQRAIDKSGELAHHLVALYEELRLLVGRTVEPDSADLERLRDDLSRFRRSVVVDGPLLPVDLERKLKDARQAATELLDRPDADIRLGDLSALKQRVKGAGDDLREYRDPRTEKDRAAKPRSTGSDKARE